MPKYGISWPDFADSTSVITMIRLVSVSKFPWEVVELAMYGGGTTAPADIQHAATFCFLSAAGAGTATSSPTPERFAQQSAAASSTVGSRFTGEPTTYAGQQPVMVAFNQRGGMRWGVPQGEGLSNTFEQTNMHAGWRAQASTAGTVTGHVHWWEK